MSYRIPVDLVPFGAVGGAEEELRWPPDMAIVMNVAGFIDANASAVQVEVDGGLVIAIASLPAIALLKLFAWADRGDTNPKDAMDLVMLIRQYHEIDNSERVFSLPAEVLERIDYDIELGGAWLLGNDASRQSSAATTERADAILEAPEKFGRLITDMARELLTQHDPENRASQLLLQFKAGFQHR